MVSKMLFPQPLKPRSWLGLSRRADNGKVKLEVGTRSCWTCLPLDSSPAIEASHAWGCLIFVKVGIGMRWNT